jgi:hypothetical protein
VKPQQTKLGVGELPEGASEMNTERGKAAMRAMHLEEEEYYGRKVVKAVEGKPAGDPADARPLLRVVAVWSWEDRMKKWVKTTLRFTYSSMTLDDLKSAFGDAVKQHPDKASYVFYMGARTRVCYEVPS